MTRVLYWAAAGGKLREALTDEAKHMKTMHEANGGTGSARSTFLGRSGKTVGWCASTALALLLVSVLGACQNYAEGTETRTVGQFTDDATIQLLVKKRLIGDPDVRGMRINVEVNRRVVELIGEVASEAERKRALEIASLVPNVERVVDRLYMPEARTSETE